MHCIDEPEVESIIDIDGFMRAGKVKVRVVDHD